jgi:hypothetical protein
MVTSEEISVAQDAYMMGFCDLDQSITDLFVRMLETFALCLFDTQCDRNGMFYGWRIARGRGVTLRLSDPNRFVTSEGGEGDIIWRAGGDGWGFGVHDPTDGYDGRSAYGKGHGGGVGHGTGWYDEGTGDFIQNGEGMHRSDPGFFGRLEKELFSQLNPIRP